MLHGTSEAIVSAIHRSWAWVNATPFGGPVVPEVYRIVARSSGPTGAHAGTAVPLPLARNVAQSITARPAGGLSRQNDTTGNCVASSPRRSITVDAPTKRISARLRRRTSSRSPGGVVGY